jgi:pimeloyl-ACP methyl ester carboxylesterase
MKKNLFLIIGLIIFLTGIMVPSIYEGIKCSECDHEHGEYDDLQGSYIPYDPPPPPPPSGQYVYLPLEKFGYETYTGQEYDNIQEALVPTNSKNDGNTYYIYSQGAYVADILLTHFFTFDVGYYWTYDYTIEDIIFNYDIRWDIGNDFVSYAWSKLYIYRYDTQSWELFSSNPLTVNAWTDSSRTKENYAGDRSFNDQYLSHLGNLKFKLVLRTFDNRWFQNPTHKVWLDYIKLKLVYSDVPPAPAPQDTLLFVHGYVGRGSQFNTLINYFEPLNMYDNILAIDYYNTEDRPRVEPEFILSYNTVDVWTSITVVAELLKDYIINRHSHGLLGSQLDIVCHSMGGLVTRYMIKYYYNTIRAHGITINKVGLIATPNYGIPFGTFGFTTQTFEMDCWLNPFGFLNTLNNLNGDDTPFSVSDGGSNANILYSTYTGVNDILQWGDGVVSSDSSPLKDNDVTNYGFYLDTSHDQMLTSSAVMSDLYAFLS